MTLSDIIIQKIAEEGPVSFDEFMEMCLYYPGLGYYTSAGDKIGARGDYYTSANLTPVVGALIGKQIEEMWHILEEQPLTIAEFGAGTGCLSHDILDYLQNNVKLYRGLRYCIIEKSAAMREKERQHLPDKVSWHGSISDVGPFTGCVLSNELIDNFPVRRVAMEDRLMEIFVGYQDDFIEVPLPASNECINYLQELDVCLPKGFCTEINLAAVQWMQEVSACLRNGFVITIDYGYTSGDLYSHRRKEGTLMCYRGHDLSSRLYENIGMQDITAHVNFSALRHWGEKYGLACCGLTGQAQFLLSLGLTQQLNTLPPDNGDIAAQIKRNAVIKHLLLFGMGDRFKVMIQRKNVPTQPLSGFTLASLRH